ncbi:cora-like Mg2+ transporter protein-domain-containing protein [Cercophora samala]|uniref:Cora-like Mg2+ transporter protein-domain-containing protein n=1 Tax=Cercophora samala TaxID=330535 RepID=A0AA39Z282_9PEZI|nr:cora-like Mg2+ transporter protein-domain-containing protein [Cercophora samala]
MPIRRSPSLDSVELLRDSALGQTSVKPSELPEAITRCLRLQIQNDGKTSYTAVDLSQSNPNPEEALEGSQNYDLIYIVEAHSDLQATRLAGMGLYLPPEFFSAHLGRGSGHKMSIRQERSAGSFFVSWSEPALQNSESWEMEKKIRAGTPWDTEQATDPQSTYESHCRWGTFPEGLYRPYHPLHPSQRKQSTVLHHAATCMSFYYSRRENGHLVGCLLVDPRRMHTLRQVNLNLWSGDIGSTALPNQPCFILEKTGLDRIKKALEAPSPFRARQNDTWIIQTMMGFVLDDMPTILFELGRGLDEVELYLGEDQQLRSSVPQWRDYLGRWRNTLANLRVSVRYMMEKLEQHSKERPRQLVPPYGDDSEQMISWRLKQINAELEAIRNRVETAFQALMSTLSILESQRAIAQAESISKLTQLAFFFIPLSFIAAVFGMNVIEFQDQYTWPRWLGVSIGVTAVTYLALYYSTVHTAVTRTIPSAITRSIKRPSIRRAGSRLIKIVTALNTLSTAELGPIPLFLIPYSSILVYSSTIPAFGIE